MGDNRAWFKGLRGRFRGGRGGGWGRQARGGMGQVLGVVVLQGLGLLGAAWG